MQMGNLMNALRNIGFGVASLLSAGSALAQSGQMMDGGRWEAGWFWNGGYGVPIIVVASVVGVLVWIFKKRKPQGYEVTGNRRTGNRRL